MSQSTLGLETLKEHILYILYSGFVKFERPLSTLIIANPERGKTTELLRYICDGLKVMNDATAYGIMDYMKKLGGGDLESLHHILIPDLERINARNKNTRRELVSTMQIMMQEGLYAIKTGYIEINLDKPKVIGFIMATTPTDFDDGRSIFRRASYLSRLLPFSYEYNSELKKNTINYVLDKVHQELESIDINQKIDKPYNVELGEKYKSHIKEIAYKLVEETDSKATHRGELIGIRFVEQTKCYLKSIALSEGKYNVDDTHLEKLLKMDKYFNYRRMELI